VDIFGLDLLVGLLVELLEELIGTPVERLKEEVKEELEEKLVEDVWERVELDDKEEYWMQTLFWHVAPTGHPMLQLMVKIEECLVPSGSRSRFGENWKKSLKCVARRKVMFH
jgi:hypothetical protein